MRVGRCQHIEYALEKFIPTFGFAAADMVVCACWVAAISSAIAVCSATSSCDVISDGCLSSGGSGLRLNMTGILAGNLQSVKHEPPGDSALIVWYSVPILPSRITR